MKLDLHAVRAQCEAFAAQHVATLAAELIEWQDTAILREGKLRELAAMSRPFSSTHDLQVAEMMTNRAALNMVVTNAATSGAKA